MACNSMEINDGEDQLRAGWRLLLHPDPFFESSEVISQVRNAGWLYSGEDDLAG